MRYCGVYFRGEAFYVHASFEDEFGVLVEAGPVVKLGRDAPPEALGSAALDALRAFREGAPPDDTFDTTKALLALSGLKSWRAFLKGASYLSVRSGGGEVRVTPTYHERGSFMFMPEEEVKSGPQPAAVGEALRKASARCR